MSRADSSVQAVGAPVPTAAPVKAGALGVPARDDVVPEPVSVEFYFAKNKDELLDWEFEEARQWLKAVHDYKKQVEVEVLGEMLKIVVRTSRGRLIVYMAKLPKELESRARLKVEIVKRVQGQPLISARQVDFMTMIADVLLGTEEVFVFGNSDGIEVVFTCKTQPKPTDYCIQIRGE